jgi:hypothetical protein
MGDFVGVRKHRRPAPAPLPLFPGSKPADGADRAVRDFRILADAARCAAVDEAVRGFAARAG